MTDEDIVNCNFDEWINYLYEKYEIIPITLFEENIHQSLQKEQVRKYNPFFGKYPYEQDFFVNEGIRILYKISFDGDSNLWHLQPNSRILTRFEVDILESSNDEEYGTIELSFQYTNKELQDKGDQIQKFVQELFEREFKNYRTMIGYVNNETRLYNTNLKTLAQNFLEERKQIASAYSQISNMLEIPMLKCDNAPNTKPIQLEKN